jgi:hypothetical protein
VRGPRMIGFTWWSETRRNDGNPAHDTDMQLEGHPELAPVFVERVGRYPQGLGRFPVSPAWSADGR